VMVSGLDIVLMLLVLGFCCMAVRLQGHNGSMVVLDLGGYAVGMG